MFEDGGNHAEIGTSGRAYGSGPGGLAKIHAAKVAAVVDKLARNVADESATSSSYGVRDDAKLALGID